MADGADVKDQTSEELGLLLNQCYNSLMREQQNITTINQELERRRQENKEE